MCATTRKEEYSAVMPLRHHPWIFELFFPLPSSFVTPMSSSPGWWANLDCASRTLCTSSAGLRTLIHVKVLVYVNDWCTIDYPNEYTHICNMYARICYARVMRQRRWRDCMMCREKLWCVRVPLIENLCLGDTRLRSYGRQPCTLDLYTES